MLTAPNKYPVPKTNPARQYKELHLGQFRSFLEVVRRTNFPTAVRVAEAQSPDK